MMLLTLAFALQVFTASVIATDDGVFDFVIIGGGTAGNALATRLSHGLPHSSILVIEAGPAALDEPDINIPGRKGSALGTKYDWNFTTVPQAGLNGRVLPVNRGKVLGGSSAINLMVWDRGAAAEYDQWEEVGNPGWNWKSMLKAMTKSENYTGLPPRPGSGKTGPVKSLVNRMQPTYQEAWIPAVTQSFNISENHDSLDGRLVGVTFQPTNIDPTHYTRSYSATAYLPLAEPNLQVLTNTQVAKINFAKRGSGHGHGKTELQRATGVTLVNGTIISARREVILSAGAIQTPQLLELSGIGQSSVLKSSKIDTLIELPGVGENYQDHPRVQISYRLRPGYATADVLRYNATAAALEMEKYRRNEKSWYDDRRGGFIFANWKQIVSNSNDSGLIQLARVVTGAAASPPGNINIGHRKKLEQLNNPTIPQIEIIFSDGYTGRNGYPPPNSTNFGQNFATFIIVLMHPLSRGSTHLNTSNPLGKPVINPRFLDNEYDIQGFIEAAKFTRRLANAEPLRSLWDPTQSEFEPGANAVQTDAQWREWVKENLFTVCHPSGTAPMLPREEGGVVDSNLVVYGTSNLRIVDWSVMPVQISGHPQTAVYGVAERAAEIVIRANDQW
ncbi:GMC oxidoreductase [Cercophora newfieldiana]|uniref:GMC oxidoreductase n=1 Tax=Cercophora newfieldiana TaxID=92897 RepID=A0AA40CSU0_9PEZI|nr:GMC oxidoreductase [Cercophora newfieldiana]